MGKMIVLEPTGAREIVWNGHKDEQEEATREFVAHMNTGAFNAFSVQTTEKGETTKTPVKDRYGFDPEGETILTPRLVGG